MGFMENVKDREVVQGLNEASKPVVKFETRSSRKTGNNFQCLVIYYKGFEKLVFLNQAEQYVFSDLK